MKRSSLQNEWVNLKKIDGFFIGSAPRLAECYISHARRCFLNVTFGHSNIFAGHVRTYFCLEKFSVQSCECVSRGFNSKRNWLLKSLIAGNRCVSLTKKTFQEREGARARERVRKWQKEGMRMKCISTFGWLTREAIVQVWQNIAYVQSHQRLGSIALTLVTAYKQAPLWPFSQHFKLFKTYKWTKKS
jgi:hypothetical protein